MVFVEAEKWIFEGLSISVDRLLRSFLFANFFLGLEKEKPIRSDFS